MIGHRKTLRDAMRACLDAGFNAAIGTLAAIYGIPAFEVDFSEASTNFWMGNTDLSRIEQAFPVEFPAIAIYTEEARDSYPNPIRGIKFAGEVAGCLDVIIRPRDGRESLDSESLLDMAEDAVLGLFATYPWPTSGAASVHYKRDAVSSKDRLVQLSDGYGQKLSIHATFGVFVP